MAAVELPFAIVGDMAKTAYPVLSVDMGPRPARLELDRKNSDGNYEPLNCRWAMRKEQNTNRRRRPGLRRLSLTKAVRLPPDILAALEKLAKADNRTVSYMINKILAEYLRAHKLIK